MPMPFPIPIYCAELSILLKNSFRFHDLMKKEHGRKKYIQMDMTK